MHGAMIALFLTGESKDMATQQPEALRLAAIMRSLGGNMELAAAELERLHAESELHLQELRSYRITVENREARIAELEAQLISESARTAEQKLRADQLEKQHAMQAKMHAHAAEQLAAARRAQVVPQGWREALTELVAAMRKYEMDVDGIATEQHRAMMRSAELLLAAAPQPPEAAVKDSLTTDAAPVQMPEPWGKEFGDGVWYNLYTEHQVRQLLAQHGIK